MEISSHLPQIIKDLEAQATVDGIQKKVVGSVIAVRDKILVVVRSRSDEFLAGYAEIPGGGVEEDQGETILEALERETKEETGLDITSVIDYVGSFDYVSGSGKKTRQFNFLVETDSDKVILDPDMEHSDHVWCRPDDKETLDGFTMSNEMRDVITNVKLPESNDAE
jgi:8-oxo-dGTP diphosphatase